MCCVSVYLVCVQCVCLYTNECKYLFNVLSFYCTCPQVCVLLRHVLALVDPFTIALEEDLKSRPSLTPELDGVTLDDVSIDRLFQEEGQCPRLAMLQGLTSRT